MIRTLGRSALTVVHELGEISLFGVGAMRGFCGQRHRLAKLIAATHEIGVRCFPIVAIVGLFTGLVMGLQLYYTLVKFGGESALGTAVALSLIRELGPVLTALMVVGQAGSAMSSELGIQRNDEQIDGPAALRRKTRPAAGKKRPAAGEKRPVAGRVQASCSPTCDIKLHHGCSEYSETLPNLRRQVLPRGLQCDAGYDPQGRPHCSRSSPSRHIWGARCRTTSWRSTRHHGWCP